MPVAIPAEMIPALAYRQIVEPEVFQVIAEQHDDGIDTEHVSERDRCPALASAAKPCGDGIEVALPRLVVAIEPR